MECVFVPAFPVLFLCLCLLQYWLIFLWILFVFWPFNSCLCSLWISLPFLTDCSLDLCLPLHTFCKLSCFVFKKYYWTNPAQLLVSAFSSYPLIGFLAQIVTVWAGQPWTQQAFLLGPWLSWGALTYRPSTPMCFLWKRLRVSSKKEVAFQGSISFG